MIRALSYIAGSGLLALIISDVLRSAGRGYHIDPEEQYRMMREDSIQHVKIVE